MAPLATKTGYKCSPGMQQFYSGGPFVLSSDASFLACACVDTIKLVDPSNAAVKSTIEGDTEPVTALALTPDDRVLFSSSHSHQITAWDLSTLTCIRSWKSHGDLVLAMASHPSGGLLATAGSDRKVLVWDVDGAFCTHFFKGHTAIVTCLLFHPDHARLLLFSAGEDSTVRVWDLRSKKCAATMGGHLSAVTSLAVSEKGSDLFSSGRDRVVNIWSLKDFTLRKTVPAFEALESVCLLRSSSSMASRLKALAGPRKREENGGSEPVFFITAGERGKVRVWDSEKAKCVLEQRDSDVCNAVCEGEGGEEKRGFASAVLLPDGEGLLCATADQQFLSYSLAVSAEGEPGFVLSKRLVGYIGEVADLRFIGEDRLAVATNLEQIYVVEASSGLCSYVLSGHSDIVLCLDAYHHSGSGTWLVVSGSKDRSVRLWDAGGGRCLGVGAHPMDVRAVAFSKKSGGFFVTGGVDGMLRVWGCDVDSVKSSRPQPSALKVGAIAGGHKKEVNSVAVSPNDGYLCSGSRDRTAQVWRLPDLVPVVRLVGHKRPVWSVEFSPVDQCVLTASGDKTVKIWAVSDGSCLKTFEGHTSTVLRAAFLSHGTQFVSSGADGLVKLWSIKNGECVNTYDEHEDKVWALAVDRSGERLATGSGDGVVNFWNDSTEAEKREALQREEDEVVKGQELENCISDSDYGRAVRMAVELGRPHRLFELFSELGGRREEAGGDDPVGAALAGMTEKEFGQLFEYVREWNTKPKMCHVAQSLLLRLLTLISPLNILEMRGILEVLEGIIPYSQRHFSRVERMIRSSFLLDFVLSRMFTVEPEGVGGGSDLDVTGRSSAMVCRVGGEQSGPEDENKKRKSERSVCEKKKKVKKVKVSAISVTG